MLKAMEATVPSSKIFLIGEGKRKWKKMKKKGSWHRCNSKTVSQMLIQHKSMIMYNDEAEGNRALGHLTVICLRYMIEVTLPRV